MCHQRRRRFQLLSNWAPFQEMDAETIYYDEQTTLSLLTQITSWIGILSFARHSNRVGIIKLFAWWFGRVSEHCTPRLIQVTTREQTITALHTPYFHRMIPRIRHNRRTIRGKRHGSHPRRMTGQRRHLYKLVTMVFKVRKGGCARAVAVEGTRSPTSSSERASSEEAEHTIQDTVKRRTRKPSERVNIAPERTPERKRPPKKKSPQDMSIANLFSDGRKCIVLAATKSSRPEFHLKNHFRECVTQTFPHSPHLRKYLESINTMFPEPQRPRKKRKSERAGSALV